MVKIGLQFLAPAVADVFTRLFLQGTTQGSTAGLNTAAQTIANSWATNIAPLTTSDQTLASVSLEDLTNAMAPNGIWLGAKPGLAGTTFHAAPAVSFVIRNGINQRSRGGHSRVYVPGIPVENLSVIDSTQWLASFQTTMNTAWDAFLGNIVSALNTAGYGSGSMAVPHYYKGHTFNHVGTAPNDYYKLVHTVVNPPVPVSPYTLTTANPIVGSQRRRNHQSV
jgi:hypothetical protein